MSMPEVTPHVSTIAAHLPFLETLESHIVARYGNDKAALQALWVLLPNRRSCITLRALFEQSGNPIPQLFALSEMDRAIGASEPLPVTKVISHGERLMLTAHEIQRAAPSFELEMTLDQATNMAHEIITLLDEFEREQISYAVLRMQDEERLAGHWQHNLRMVNHIALWWQHHSQAHKVISVIHHQQQCIDSIRAQWEASPPEHGVIVAGSMGTHTATRNLLKTIAALPSGEVIIAGLDTQCDDELWQQIEPTHPHYGVKRLLEAIGMDRSDVKQIGKPQDDSRSVWLSHALLPANLTHRWLYQPPALSCQPLFHLIEAKSEWQEVQAITKIVKETDKTVAVITPDDALLRRLQAALRCEGIPFNSAQGVSVLGHVKARGFLALLDVVAEPENSVALLGLLKIIPACDAVCAVIDQFEIAHLRGLQRKGHATLRLHEMMQLTTSDDVRSWVENTHRILESWFALLHHTSMTPASIWQTHRACAAALDLIVPEDDWLVALESSLQDLPPMSPQDYPNMLRELLGQMTIMETSSREVRVQLLSPIEARFVMADCVVLAGLNEGQWPQRVAAGAWLNDAMRLKIGLAPKEYAIGQSAHDFYMLSHASQVFYTRSGRQSGAATLPSRWITRLQSCVTEGQLLTVHTADEWLGLPVFERNVIAAPAPNPPVASRPKQLSISDVDRCLKDPYALYAKHILKLKALDPIDAPLDAKERGNVTHKVLERFSKAVNRNADFLNERWFMKVVSEVLAEFEDYPQVALMWLPRFTQLAPWMVTYERERRKEYPNVIPEESYHLVLGQWRLNARVDWRGSNADNQHLIVDYKSGSSPKVAEVKSGFACQLPLMAWMVQQALGGSVNGMVYCSIGTGFDEPEKTGIDQDTKEWIEEYVCGVEVLLNRYLGEQVPFYAIPQPLKAPRYNDYEHLARVKEWLV